MTLPPFYCTVILFIGLTSVNSLSYEDIHLAFSNSPRLIYTESESNPIFSGYSYATQDLNGGESNVVFTTGVDSLSRLQHEMNSVKLSERNILEKTQKNLPSEQFGANEQGNLDSSVEHFKEEKGVSKSFETNDNFVERQAPLQQISFLPYPFRTNLLNLPTVLPGYHVSPSIQNYYPHDSYSQLKVPLHNVNFYNPPLSLFYRAAIAIPSNSSGHTSTAAHDFSKVSLESSVESSQLNATASESSSVESSVIESRSNLESTTNADIVDNTNKSATSIDNLEFMTTSKKAEEEITSINPVKSAVTSKSSVEQTTTGKTSTMELANTELNPVVEKFTTLKTCT